MKSSTSELGLKVVENLATTRRISFVLNINKLNYNTEYHFELLVLNVQEGHAFLFQYCYTKKQKTNFILHWIAVSVSVLKNLHLLARKCFSQQRYSEDQDSSTQFQY